MTKFTPIIILLFFILISGCSNKVHTPKSNDTLCIGPVSAQHGVIYLHGLDSSQGSSKELDIKNKLIKISNKLNIRIALPRGPNKCNNKTCWGWSFSKNEVERSLNKIFAASAYCQLPKKNLGLIVFSNGGYFNNYLFYKNLYSNPKLKIDWGISAASARLNGDLPPNTNLPHGQLTLIIGNKDRFNFDPKQNLFLQLQNVNPQVYLEVFDGGHQFPQNNIGRVIQKMISSQIKNSK